MLLSAIIVACTKHALAYNVNGITIGTSKLRSLVCVSFGEGVSFGERVSRHKPA
jgi:hypothetical protein